MVELLAFTALAIDFGTAYYQRQKLQTACDAAALAGVQYLPDTTKAESVARDYLAANFNNTVTASVEFLDSNHYKSLKKSEQKIVKELYEEYKDELANRIKKNK